MFFESIVYLSKVAFCIFRYLLSLGLLFLALNLNAQYEGKTQKKYEEAIHYLEGAAFQEGIKSLKEVVSKSPQVADGYISLAGVYSELKKYDSALLYFRLAKNVAPSQYPRFQLQFAIAQAGIGNFDMAYKEASDFLNRPQLTSQARENATRYLNDFEFALHDMQKHRQHNYEFAPKNLGDFVNSFSAEYYPSVTYDDSILYFTRRGDGVQEDFFRSLKQKNGDWGPAEILSGSINKYPSKGAIDIAQDGDMIVFAGNFPFGGFGNFDIYLSFKDGNDWTEPMNLGPNINTEYWESSPSLSVDKKALYFSSNRPGGFGGTDLYVSYLQPDGQWGPAINMGAAINSTRDELAPCIHADNQTLYFTSNGLQGYGGSDIFLVRKDSAGHWGTPENMGYPINTIDNEGSLFVSSDGVHAYYASDRSDSRGKLDLYRFELRQDIRPVRTVFVSGKVMDEDTREGINAQVEVSPNDQPAKHHRYQTDKFGNYMISLPADKDYTVTLNSKGYLFQSEAFNLKNKQNNKNTWQKDILLSKLKLNASVNLKNIQFDFNSSTLEPVSQIELKKVLSLLQENPTVHLQINGHTDNIGTDKVNIPLSQARAKAVVNYLIANGIASERLQYKGFGATQPLVSNDTEEGRMTNRRTEILIVGM